MGIRLNAPLTSHAVVYTLPMLTIKEDKGNEAYEHHDTISSQLQMFKALSKSFPAVCCPSAGAPGATLLNYV